MPAFLMALLMIYLFAYWLGWFPVQGGRGPGRRHPGLLPRAAVGGARVSVGGAGGPHHARASLLAVLDEDYMRTARAKGLSEAVILQVHAYRNALVPILAVLGLFFGQLLGGAAVAEIVFGGPSASCWWTRYSRVTIRSRRRSSASF